jgi:hypothetical protein
MVQAVAALVAPASAVLLDEPTAGLDPTRRATLATGLGPGRRHPVVVASQDTEWLGWVGGQPSRRIRRSRQPVGCHPDLIAGRRVGFTDGLRNAPGDMRFFCPFSRSRKNGLTESYREV